MPDKLMRNVIEELAGLWRDFTAVIRLIAGDIDLAGKKTDSDSTGSRCGPDSRAEPAAAELNGRACADSQNDGGADGTAEPGAGLDEYFDEIDGFMDEIGKKPAEPEKPPDQADQ